MPLCCLSKVYLNKGMNLFASGPVFKRAMEILIEQMNTYNSKRA